MVISNLIRGLVKTIKGNNNIDHAGHFTGNIANHF
jgi:hypothetical protein